MNWVSAITFLSGWLCSWVLNTTHLLKDDNWSKDEYKHVSVSDQKWDLHQGIQWSHSSPSEPVLWPAPRELFFFLPHWQLGASFSSRGLCRFRSPAQQPTFALALLRFLGSSEMTLCFTEFIQPFKHSKEFQSLLYPVPVHNMAHHKTSCPTCRLYGWNVFNPQHRNS